jgi:hypothetical protein
VALQRFAGPVDDVAAVLAMGNGAAGAVGANGGFRLRLHGGSPVATTNTIVAIFEYVNTIVFDDGAMM